MKTKHPSFSSAVAPLSARVFTEFDLREMDQYKLGLIDDKTTMLLGEIKRVEAWLKVKWTEFQHDKNRRVSA